MRANFLYISKKRSNFARFGTKIKNLLKTGIKKMKKIFTILCGMLLATGAFAELGYNATLTQSDFNSSSTVVKKEGTIEWDNDHVRCGGSSNGISLGGPSWNWDDKYFDVKIANGVPNKLTFEWACNNITSTDAEWYVKESADGTNWSAAIWETTSSAISWTSVSKDLQPNTRYIRFCFSGNFAGNFRNIKVTEKILMGTPNPTALDFGTVKVDDEASKSFTLGWTNLTATVTGATDQFTVTPENFGQIGAYTQTATISVALNTSVAGEYSTTVHVAGRGKSADVPVTAKVEKYDQTINWDAAASYNYGEAIPVAVATSGLDVDYEISDASVLKFENGAFVALHGGEATVTAKQAGNYKYNAAADVVKTITIVPPTTYGDFEQTTCDEAVEFNNQTYEESFSGEVPVGENYLGGDSIVHVNIVINHATFGTEEMTITVGDDVEWNGIALKDSTVGVHSALAVLTNAAGCDSIVTLTLTVNKQETLNVPVDLTFCAGDSAEFRGKWYFSAEDSEEISAEGTTRDTLYVINVTVLQPSFVEEDMTIIVGTDTAWNGIALKDSTVGVHTVVAVLTNAVGCDSTVTLTLTVNKLEMLETEYQIEICEGSEQEYRGVTYNEEGMFTLDLIEGETRDTLLTVVVTVNAKGYEEILLTDTIGNTIEIPEGEWTLGDDIVSGSYQIQETDIEGLVFVQIGETEKGCEAVTKIIVTVEEKPQDQGDPTGFENVGEAQKAVKEFRNGVLYIRRGEKMYTASGELVK